MVLGIAGGERLALGIGHAIVCQAVGGETDLVTQCRLTGVEYLDMVSIIVSTGIPMNTIDTYHTNPDKQIIRAEASPAHHANSRVHAEDRRADGDSEECPYLDHRVSAACNPGPLCKVGGW